MSHSAAKACPRFTWADYQQWPDDERWEIVGGEAYAMSPSPTVRHQHIARELAGPVIAHFKGKPCRPFFAPMDVKLSEEDIVQPDLLVVCEPAQIRRTHIEGPPALVVEILSPASWSHDRLRKLLLYARSGVQEYWIVTPFPSVVEVLALRDTQYVVHGVYGPEDTLVSALFPDLRLPLADVFDFPLEPGEELPEVREPPATYRARRPVAPPERGQH